MVDDRPTPPAEAQFGLGKQRAEALQGTERAFCAVCGEKGGSQCPFCLIASAGLNQVSFLTVGCSDASEWAAATASPAEFGCGGLSFYNVLQPTLTNRRLLQPTLTRIAEDCDRVNGRFPPPQLQSTVKNDRSRAIVDP
jgi:hypothetical protein